MSEMKRPHLRVKVLSSLPAAIWMHQFPHNEPVWGECEFTFERDARDYDWLLVYDDLPERKGEPKKTTREELACSRAHTLLVTSEPSSVKIYGDSYTRQFGAVLTSQPEWALPHPQRIFSQPALHWFYGMGSREILPFDRMLDEPPLEKSRDASMVYSPKAMRHTLHHHRARFMRWLVEHMPELDTFGRTMSRSRISSASITGPRSWPIPSWGCRCPSITVARMPRTIFLRTVSFGSTSAIRKVRSKSSVRPLPITNTKNACPH